MKVGVKSFKINDFYQSLGGMLKLKEQSLSIDDSMLEQLYDDDHQFNKQIFVYRIYDSNTYLLIFHTGLLLHLSANPLAI